MEENGVYTSTHVQGLMGFHSRNKGNALSDHRLGHRFNTKKNVGFHLSLSRFPLPPDSRHGAGYFQYCEYTYPHSGVEQNS